MIAGKPSERGAALFAVLAMVALLASFAGMGLSRLRAATDRIQDSGARSEAQFLANAGTTTAISMVNRLKARSRMGATSLEEPILLEYGESRVQVRFSDGGNCFNLNSLSRPPASASAGESRAAASPQDLSRLLQATGIPLLEADNLAKATAARLGSTGLMWADGSEWLTISGVTAAHWQLAGRFLCALPTREATIININSLKPDSAPLLAGIGMGADEARRAISSRPTAGWSNSDDFLGLSNGGSGNAENGEDAVAQSLTTSSRWMILDVLVQTPQAMVRRELLIDTIRQPARVVSSQWHAVEVTS